VQDGGTLLGGEFDEDDPLLLKGLTRRAVGLVAAVVGVLVFPRKGLSQPTAIAAVLVLPLAAREALEGGQAGRGGCPCGNPSCEA
jgi:hypothetical protein